MSKPVGSARRCAAGPELEADRHAAVRTVPGGRERLTLSVTCVLEWSAKEPARVCVRTNIFARLSSGPYRLPRQDLRRHPAADSRRDEQIRRSRRDDDCRRRARRGGERPAVAPGKGAGGSHARATGRRRHNAAWRRRATCTDREVSENLPRVRSTPHPLAASLARRVQTRRVRTAARCCPELEADRHAAVRTVPGGRERLTLSVTCVPEWSAKEPARVCVRTNIFARLFSGPYRLLQQDRR